MTAVYLALAFCFGLGARSAGLPPLVGFMAAGVVLHFLGERETPALHEVAHLGVLLLLFTVGLKLRLRNLLRPEVWGGGLTHIALIAAGGWLLLSVTTSLRIEEALVLAFALTFSSTVVAAKVLESKRELKAFHGRVAVGLLIAQDIVAVVLLGLTGEHSVSIWAIWVLALPFAAPLLHRLLDMAGHDELLTLFGAVLAVCVGGLGFHLVGLSAELGALLLGALIAEHPRSGELYGALWNLKEVMLVGFFIQIGMAGLPDWNGVLYAALLLGIFLPFKVAVIFAVLLLFRLRGRSSFLASMSLASYSEFALIVASPLAVQGTIDSSWITILALTVAISFAASAPLNSITHSLYVRHQRAIERFESKRRHPDDEPITFGSAQVAVFGMGRVGTGAYDHLKLQGVRVVGFDSDPSKVAHHIQQHRRVLYADAEDSALWPRLNMQKVRAVLLALPDLEARTLAAEQLRLNGYRGLIAAVNVFPEEEAVLRQAGVDLSHNFFEQAGPAFAEHCVAHLDAERKP